MTFGTKPRPELSPKFVSLAPTAGADDTGVYAKALNFATTRKDIFNIALTGPYGSGKSSVIETFLAKYPKEKALRLSLASFVPAGDNQGEKPQTPEIERSLLQQILYGAEANKLPFSRFKRIQTPKRSAVFTSLLLVVGMACAWYLISKQADILTGTFFKPVDFSNWLNLSSLAFASVLAWTIIHGVYKKSFGLSLKSISLKDVEIAADGMTDTSILNRHLDEILYFFQSTKYDLVVIEDLDRFKNADIFVTLREINGLINSNKGVKRPVRFLYALRDDMFANKDRTKFFEFIVPVIPVINHSNSVDKVLERSQSLNLDVRLDKEFVRDVSRHLTDLRLIHNIFNEYLVYSENLKEEKDGHLNPNKLLAVLIYKNVFPSDFAALHRQEGVLANVLSRHEEYISKAEDEVKEKISTINSDLENGEAQNLRDVVELRMVYAMAIARRVPSNYLHVRLPSGEVAVRELADSTLLEEVISRRTLQLSDPYGRSQSLDLSDLERSVDPNRTFAERTVELEHKSAKFKHDAQQELRELRSQLASLRTRKFNEVVRQSINLIGDAFVGVTESVDLLRFLILEGYLDDTYYQYISLFHKGRLSQNDNRFLIQIRAYRTPPPDFPIDNVVEVIASMRREDFGHNYVLNRFVVDQILDQAGSYLDQTAAMADFMATHFDECEDFFRAYYSHGAQVPQLVEILASRWREFPTVALTGPDTVAHAARILSYAPSSMLSKENYSKGVFAEFLSTGAREVLSEGISFDLSRLLALQLQIVDLASLGDFPDVVEFVTENGLYQLSIDNIAYIFARSAGQLDTEIIHTQHYTALLHSNNQPLLKRVEADFETYVSGVLLELESNTEEDLDSISNALAHDEVNHDARAEFLRRQSAVFINFEGIPEEFHVTALENRKIVPSWNNCLAFIESNAYSTELLTRYLQSAETHAALAKQQVPTGDRASILREFLVGNDELSQDVYRSYVRQLPTPFPDFPEVDGAKLRVLIEERKVLFTLETFESLKEVALQVQFVALNFGNFKTNEHSFSIDDSFRSKLLRTNITDEQKLEVIRAMAPGYVPGSPAVAALVGPIIDRSLSPIAVARGPDFIHAIIRDARPIQVQVSLFNKLHTALSPADVYDLLAALPEPFKGIAGYGRFPKIENTDMNRQFASWLKQRNLISSFSAPLGGDKIKINTFRKKG